MFSETTGSDLVLEPMPDALLGIDQKRMTMLVNRKTERRCGYDPEDVCISLPRIDTGVFRLDRGGA